MRRRKISDGKRFRILKRSGFRCVYCGAKAGEVELEIDHVHPVALGGTDAEHNLVAACQRCNGGKSDQEPDWTVCSFGDQCFLMATPQMLRDMAEHGVYLDEILFHPDTDMSDYHGFHCREDKSLFEPCIPMLDENGNAVYAEYWAQFGYDGKSISAQWGPDGMGNDACSERS